VGAQTPTGAVEMKGLMYYSGGAYETMMRLVHRGVFYKRYNAVRSLLGCGPVLDLGCGTGLIQEHLNNDYLGLEKNPGFVSYAQRKNRNVYEEDIQNFHKYLKGRRDTVLLMDVLHHVPHPGDLIEKIISSGANKIVICEPYNLPEHPIYSNAILNRIFDADGINGPNKWFDRENLIEFYKTYGGKDFIELRNSIITRIPLRGMRKTNAYRSTKIEPRYRVIVLGNPESPMIPISRRLIECGKIQFNQGDVDEAIMNLFPGEEDRIPVDLFRANKMARQVSADMFEFIEYDGTGFDSWPDEPEYCSSNAGDIRPGNKSGKTI
jgi:SAM-dependent methyltransferase